MRTKIDIGICIGNENSSIARMEGGNATIKKTDVLKDTMPSYVHVTKKGAILVGDKACNLRKADESKLQIVYYRLEKTNSEFGNDNTNVVVEQFKEQVPEIIKEQNVKVAREVIDSMNHLILAICPDEKSLKKLQILKEIDKLKTILIDNLESNQLLS
ncbi:MAG: Hsp70 family protein [Bacteroidales bacterium]